MRRVALTFLAALWLIPAASAHIFVTSLAPNQFVLLTPNDEGATIVGVRLELPPGLHVEQLEAKPGWRTTADGWTGGRVPPGRFTGFGVVVTEPQSRTQVVIGARETLANGETKTFQAPVELGPAPAALHDSGARTLGKAALALAAAAAAIALAAGAVALSGWLRA